jgi:hypothetical protein
MHLLYPPVSTGTAVLVTQWSRSPPFAANIQLDSNMK